MVGKDKTIIGRAEKAKFPELNNLVLHARIDTGARTSSIHVLSIKESAKGLTAVFGGGPSQKETTTKLFPHYERVVVVSSMGHQQVRFKVRLMIVLKGRRVRATFTLADRSTQVYPVLIGRALLNQKFIVDVSRGSPLKELEERRSEKLQSSIISESKI